MGSSPTHPDSRLIESSFEILPGEIRQVRVPLDPRWATEGALFYGWITSETGCAIVDACVGKMEVDIREVPADVDPREANWIASMSRIPPGEDLILFVKNTGDRAARYRGRWR